MSKEREEAPAVADGEKPPEKPKAERAMTRQEAERLSPKIFLASKENAKKLKAVAEEYGFTVDLNGSDVKHNIPSDQLPALIALVK